MSHSINRVAVIGAGTMGAAIAAHCANAGVPVYLLDAVPETLTPEEERKDLTLASPAVRNRLVQAGFDRMRKARPANLFTEGTAGLITLGNTADNLDWLREADWIVEVIVEHLESKRELMTLIEPRRKPDAIVTTNTSGIPINQIAEGRSPEFKAHFLGTHFFNPPRYMRLLELIPAAETDPEVVRAMAAFAAETLGKGVVRCKDTPNFIANRLGSFAGMNSLRYIFDQGFTVEEVDALTGTLIGRPKTATFRLLDLAGIDIAAGVARNLQQAVSDDESRDALAVPPLLETMISAGRLGNKTGQGFYKEVREGSTKSYWVLDFGSMEYRPPRPVDLPLARAASKHRDLPERLRFLVQYADEHPDDRYAQLIVHDLLPPLAYAARRVPEIADSLTSVDRAMEWGYGHQAGPFATWDALGVAETVRRMRARGIAVAPWVEHMLAGGNTHFYVERDGRRWEWDPARGEYAPVPVDPRSIDMEALRRAGREVAANRSASLIDLGDGVLLLEFHSKLNTLDSGTFEMTRQALEALREPRWVGLVIGNQGADFCVGANVLEILGAAQAEQWEQIDRLVRAFHKLQQALRYSSKPVVTAPFGRVLGGGAEVAMYGTRAVAAAETYIGLVEVGVGLIPGGGGCTEMVRRVVNPHMRAEGAHALPAVQRIFQTIGLAKVSGSAAEARELGLLRASDRIVMNRDHLLSEAKQEVLDLAAAGYRPPVREPLYAAGRDTLAALRIGLHTMKTGGYASEYDAHIGNMLARILCGGDLSAGQWADEQVFLDLEREAFVALSREPKTHERIKTLLETGKPARN